MRRSILLIAACMCLMSCENNELLQTEPGYVFCEQILEGYFIKSIAFDLDGNAWAGTFKQGLIKFGSEKTTVYHSGNSIIPDSAVIYDIAVDGENNVWIGCNGLIKYDGASFTLYNSSNSAIPEDFVHSIVTDSKDNIWFSSSRFRQGGIVRFDGIDFTVYTPENSDLPVNLLNGIAVDHNDNVWLAFNDVKNEACLAKVTDDHWTIFTSRELGFRPYHIGNIQINSRNQLCASIDYSYSSLYYNSGPQVFIFDGISAEQLRYDSVSNVRFLTIDSNDNIWCGAYGGYAFYNGDNWAVNNASFGDQGVFAIEESPDGDIWIGTGDGIYIGSRTK